MQGLRKSQIAVTALVELAMQQQTGGVPLSRLTGQVSASKSYLEQIFAALRRRGLVTGFRGNGGGYRLARPAEEISMADVMLALDASGLAEAGTGPAAVHDAAWRELLVRVHAYLALITLADLLDKHRSRVLAA